MVVVKRTPDFAKSIREGWDLYVENFGLCFFASLVAMILSVFFILIPPMHVGLFQIMLRLQRKDPERPRVSDIFNGFRFFLPSFLAMLILIVSVAVVVPILGVIPMVGQMLELLLCILFFPMAFFSGFLIADGKTSIDDAVVCPIKLLATGSFWMFALISCVACAGVSVLGVAVVIIGIFITQPLCWAVIASAYSQMVDDEKPAPPEDVDEPEDADTPEPAPEM